MGDYVQPKQNCHICHHAWPAHAADCRVRLDLPRMERVLDRLVAESRQAGLQERLRWYIAAGSVAVGH
ncbi:MAG: hypothetical protein ACM31L_18115 [Actinomycetota bacterium]